MSIKDKLLSGSGKKSEAFTGFSEPVYFKRLPLSALREARKNPDDTFLFTCIIAKATMVDEDGNIIFDTIEDIENLDATQLIAFAEESMKYSGFEADVEKKE